MTLGSSVWLSLPLFRVADQDWEIEQSSKGFDFPGELAYDRAVMRLKPGGGGEVSAPRPLVPCLLVADLDVACGALYRGLFAGSGQ